MCIRDRYDTYGFPLDLTQLMAREKDMSVDEIGFNESMDRQKKQAKEAGQFNQKTDDLQWVTVTQGDDSKFVGYEVIECTSSIRRYTKVEDTVLVILEKTPFYAESGGQVGDIGHIESNDGDIIHIHDTIKEGNLTVHLCKNLPKKIDQIFRAFVDHNNRYRIQCNHTATHLLHQALKNILGDHVEQKGSRVSSENFRFDFSHFSKLDRKDIVAVENFVNSRIENAIDLEENRNVPIKKALESGAIGLFGEKYGDVVRTIKYGKSYELCGGTHVKNTSELWQFKIISESAIASGIRRVEAITCLLYTSPSPRDATLSRMPSSA